MTNVDIDVVDVDVVERGRLNVADDLVAAGTESLPSFRKIARMNLTLCQRTNVTQIARLERGIDVGLRNQSVCPPVVQRSGIVDCCDSNINLRKFQTCFSCCCWVLRA